MARSTGSNPRNANGHRRRSLKRRMRAQGLPCWLCGYPIDYALPSNHRHGFVVDEEETIRDGGSPTDPRNTHPAHRCCNAWRGAKPVTPKLKAEIRKRYEREMRKMRTHRSETRVGW